MKKVDVVAALDSFKGALSSREAGLAFRRGFLLRNPGAAVTVLPVGDGGEGTADALLSATCGERIQRIVSDSHGAPVSAEAGFLPGNVRRAVFDMAAVAGIRMAAAHGYDLLRSTTRGVGELIRSLIAEGVDEILIGLGGSGTSDGGIGALSALGVRFFCEDGSELTDPRTGDLGDVARADFTDAWRLLGGVRLTLLCDAAVPLTGPAGAVRMFSRQKGATEEMVPHLEEAMGRYAAVICRDAGADVISIPGAGAAGGLGFGLAAVGGVLTDGASAVLEAVGAAEAMECASLVVTGEGKTDAQTAKGKLPLAVARLAKRVRPDLPVVCLCGIAEPTPELYKEGIDAVLSIADRPMSAEESMARTAELIEKTAFSLAGLFPASGT